MSEDEVLITIGENIKKAREGKGMSLEEIAFKTNIRIEYFKKIEQGKAKRLSAGHIFIIAEALNIMPHVLVKDI